MNLTCTGFGICFSVNQASFTSLRCMRVQCVLRGNAIKVINNIVFIVAGSFSSEKLLIVIN